MDPLVSIIIPVYNGANYLREAIDSALAQTYSNIEIIVVNDGSNDDGATRDIALSYANRGEIKYFEKENGGVSTALNLGIQNMRGKYFSWLSHDDVYMPEKVQVEIDALRQVGDMSRVVYSNWSSWKMPEGKIEEFDGTLTFRQEFLETGAFAPLFGFISGCSLLIPKFLFDIYGGFDETFRAVQDYKKWFEMFRGRRLVYVRQSLILSRKHAEQTTHKYTIRMSEEHWLYHWMIYNLHKDDIVGSELTDLYHVYSGLFTRWLDTFLQPELNFLTRKMLELPESPGADERIKTLNDFINNNTNKIYFPKEQEVIMRMDFRLRGISLDQKIKFVPYSQFENLKADKDNWPMIRFDLMQILIDVPIKKKCLEEELVRQAQGGQKA